MKKLLFAFTLLVMSLSARGAEVYDDVTINGITYKLFEEFPFANDQGENGTRNVALVKKGDSQFPSGAFYIPSSVRYQTSNLGLKDFDVLIIDDEAFSGNTKIKTLYIPSSVRIINNTAFRNMTSLEKVYFLGSEDAGNLAMGYDDGVQNDELFYGCSNLTDVELDRNITYIDGDKEKPFEDLENLKTLTIGKYVTHIPYALFEDSGLETIIFKEDCALESIGNGAFRDCDKLKTVDLSGCTKLKTLDEECFFDCNVLETVKFPPSLMTIGVNAFDHIAGYDSMVHNVYFYGDETSATSILEMKDVDNFNEATFVYLDRNITNSEDDAIFERCNKLEFGTHLTSIPDYAFSECTIVGLAIPPSVTKIGYKAFYNCDGLKFVCIVDTSTPLQFATRDGKSYAFDSCSKLVLLQLGRNIEYDTSKVNTSEWNTMTNMELSPFWDAYVQNVTIGDSVTKILPYLLEDCNDMTSIVIGKNVESIGYGVFKDCSDLKSVTFSPSDKPVTIYPYGHFSSYVGDQAFKDCELVTFDMGRDIVDARTRGEVSFFHNEKKDKLTTVTIGEEVTKVNSHMFNGCTALADLTIDASKATIHQEAFENCTGIKTLRVMGKVHFSENAFKGCSGLQEVSFLGNCSFEGNAFSGCNNIRKVNVRYDASPTIEAGPENTFTNDVYTNATLGNISDNSSFAADFSQCLPWSKFTQRAAYVGSPIGYYTTDNEELVSDADVAGLQLKMDIHADSAFFLTLPFEVDPYYFGPDAEIYEFDSKGGFCLTDVKKNTNSLPVNEPLLIIAHKRDSLVQGFFNLFAQKTIHAHPMSTPYERTIQDAVITSSQQVTTCNTSDDYYKYVVVDGILKRVNKDGLRVPAFGVVISDSSKKLQCLYNPNNQKQIAPNGFDLVPNALLEGYITFYCEDTDCEVVTVNGDSEVYTVTGRSDGAIELHKVEDGIVNRGQAVLIHGVAGQEMYLRAVTNPSADTEAYDNNLLLGVANDTPVSELDTEGAGYIYVLSGNSSKGTKVAFYKYGTSQTLGAHKAYLDASKMEGAKMLTFSTEETLIAEPLDDETTDGPAYDLSGGKADTQRQKGVYIIDNKKVIKK